MRAHLPDFIRHLADRRSPRTVKTYGAILASFLAFLDAANGGHGRLPRRCDIEAFLGRHSAGGGRRAASTRNQELAALRAFAKFAELEHGWTRSPMDGVPFRHSTATLALTMGADLSTVGDLLRHSDLNTTRRYLHLVGRDADNDALRDLVAEHLSPWIVPRITAGTTVVGA